MVGESACIKVISIAGKPVNPNLGALIIGAVFVELILLCCDHIASVTRATEIIKIVGWIILILAIVSQWFLEVIRLCA